MASYCTGRNILDGFNDFLKLKKTRLELVRLCALFDTFHDICQCFRRYSGYWRSLAQHSARVFRLCWYKRYLFKNVKIFRWPTIYNFICLRLHLTKNASHHSGWFFIKNPFEFQLFVRWNSLGICDAYKSLHLIWK